MKRNLVVELSGAMRGSAGPALRAGPQMKGFRLRASGNGAKLRAPEIRAPDYGPQVATLQLRARPQVTLLY